MSNSAASQFSNNPFIDDPTNSAGRFPDINTLERSSMGYSSPSPSGFSYPTNNSGMGYAQPQPTGYGMQPQYQQYSQPSPQPQAQPQPQYQQYSQPSPQPQAQPQPQVQQQQGSYGSWQPQGPSSPYGYGAPSGFGSGSISPQPNGMQYQTSFGGGMPQQYPQQQQQQLTGYPSPQYSAGSYPGPGPGYGGQQGYAAQPQPQAQAQSSVSEFDPLRSQTTPSNVGLGPNGQTHPREFIRSHKKELELWDSVTWKQALGLFDSLREAWEAHKSRVTSQLQQGGYYLHPVDGQRLQGLQRDAEVNVDTVAASSIQMQEVLSGYRQSADYASRNRVRESLNAAISSLPDWPPQNW